MMDYDDSPDLEGDTKEEEYLVYVDFGPHLPFDELVDPETQIKIIGLDTDTPLAQVNGRFYQGDYDYAMGTKLFFAEAEEDMRQHWFGERHSSKSFKFMDKTDKVLTMNRIFVTSKSGAGDSEMVTVKSEEEDGATQGEKYKVKTTYSGALSRFLPHGSQPPREIPVEEDGADLLVRSYCATNEEGGDEGDNELEDGNSN